MHTTVTATDIDQKPPVAAPPRGDESDGWLVGLFGSLLLTNLGVVMVVINYLP